MFSHAKSLKKVEALQKRALRFLFGDFNSPMEGVLKKSGKVCMEVNRLRHLCIEIYKTINDINPSFMKQIFSLRQTNRTVRNQYKLNISALKVNQVSYGEKSLRYHGPKVWNSLPFHVKTSENLKIFKDIIKNWDGSTCNCRVCQSWTELCLFKFFLLVQHLLILYRPHIKFWCINIPKLFVFNEIVVIKVYYFKYMKCFHWVSFSYSVSQGLFCNFIIVFIFVGLD